jgi:hypothetical protein
MRSCGVRSCGVRSARGRRDNEMDIYLSANHNIDKRLLKSYFKTETAEEITEELFYKCKNNMEVVRKAKNIRFSKINAKV